jgi:hypothetical protein
MIQVHPASSSDLDAITFVVIDLIRLIDLSDHAAMSIIPGHYYSPHPIVVSAEFAHHRFGIPINLGCYAIDASLGK